MQNFTTPPTADDAGHGAHDNGPSNDDPATQLPNRTMDTNAAQMSIPLGKVSSVPPDMSQWARERRVITAVHTYPLNGNPSTLARKVMNGLAEHARSAFSKFSIEERQRMIESRGSPMWRIQVGALRAMLEISSKDTQRIYEAIEALYQWDIRWEMIAGDGDDAHVAERFTSRIISSYGTGSKASPGTISFEFPPDVLTFMLEQRPRTQIDLRVINALGSGYAVALYDLCVPYFGTSQRVTPMRPVEEWINVLAGPGKYHNKYRDFKRYVLKVAVKWLESVDSCPFTVELNEISGAKGRITHLQFQLSPKRQEHLDLQVGPLTWPEALCEVLEIVYGMNRPEIQRLASTHTEGELAEAIQRDRELHAMGMGSERAEVPRGRYLMGLVKNVQLGRPRHAEPDQEDLQPASPRISNARDSVKALRARFEQDRNHLLSIRLDRLEPARLDLLRSVFIERIERGLLANAPEKKVIQRGWRRPKQSQKTHESLILTFCQWLAEKEPDVCVELLPHPEEHDFAVWLMLEYDAVDAKVAHEKRAATASRGIGAPLEHQPQPANQKAHLSHSKEPKMK